MSIWQKLGRLLFGDFRAESSDSLSPKDWFLEFLRGSKTKSGLAVSEKRARSYAPWCQGITRISTDVARTPIHLMRSLQGGGKERAKDHAGYYLARRKFCDEQTSFVFVRAMTGVALTHGNGYGYILRDRRTLEPLQIWPLDQEHTFPVRVNGVLWYTTKIKLPDNRVEWRKLSPMNVLHIKGLTGDGLVGYSVFDQAREALGLGLATEEFGARFFSQGGKASGVLMFPNKLSPTKKQEVRENWHEMHEELESAHKLAILDNGVKFQATSINQSDSQFLETREFQRAEIGGFLNLNPYFLGDKSHTSYASLEQVLRSYYDQTIEPWYTAWECELWDKLLTEDEKRSGEYEFEFLRLSILRADAAARASYYNTMILNGTMVRSEVRDIESMNPIPGLDKPLIPLNMGTVEPDGSVNPPPTAARTNLDIQANGNTALLLSQRHLVVATASRLIRWERAQVAKLAKQPQGFLPKIDELYSEHEPKLRESLLPVCGCIAALIPGMDAVQQATELAKEHVSRARGAILEAAGSAKAEELEHAVGMATKDWESTLSQAMADQILPWVMLNKSKAAEDAA